MASRDPARPNILFVLSDDQGCWALGCAGNKEIRTPRLDQLAAQGTRFENFFCASPVCSPARASLLTGRIPSQHGVHDWLSGGNIPGDKGGRPIEYLQGQPGYTDYLAAAGYRCGISGKWHMGDSLRPQKSFSYWEVHAVGGGPYYGAPMVKNGEVCKEPRYITDVFTDNALKFLESAQNDERPFFLYVPYTAPHSPWGREHHPPELYDSYFNDCPFESVPKGLKPPEWAKFLGIPVNDEETRRKHLSGYYAAVTAMDANIGRLLDWLDAANLRRNTLVIFMSDNGMNMGHHGVFGKGNATFPLNMFDESVKVPCLVSRPGHVPEGVTQAALLSQYDFMPTLLEYAGVANPQAETLPGRSFAPLLRGSNMDEREQVVVFDEYGPVRMVRTKDWKYVHRFPYGLHELYDLRNDPGEQRNQAGQPECAAVEADLRQRLAEWFLKYVDPRRDGAREPVTGIGQFGLCGPASNGAPNFAPLPLLSAASGKERL
jgi:arylsulfatase A-like enzyme